MVSKKNVPETVNFLEALKTLCAERDVSTDVMFDAIEKALDMAYKKNFDAAENVEVNLDRQNGNYHVYALKDVVEDVTDPIRQISLEAAHQIEAKYELGDVARVEVTPRNFGRIAAQAAKQFVVQKIREIERGMLYDEFSGKENDIVSGTVVRVDNGNKVIIDIGKAEAVLLPTEQINAESYKIGDHIKAYIAEVKKDNKGPQIYLSRTHPGLLKRLFELEVPEIQDGIIEIKSMVREPGMRSKVSVISKDENIDPVGTCIGNKGVRVQAIVNEIGGNEKIDLINWNANPGIYIANAISPAKVKNVWINESEKVARVVVPNNQLSLAIGKEGQNARLAAKLTGWKIDIKSVAQSKEMELPEGMTLVQLKPPKPPKPPKPNTDNNNNIDNNNVDGVVKKKKKKKKKKKRSQQQQEQPQQQQEQPQQQQEQPQQQQEQPQ